MMRRSGENRFPTIAYPLLAQIGHAAAGVAMFAAWEQDFEEPVMGVNSIATTDGVRRARILRNRLLFMLTISSGAVDAISFLALGKVFTAFMTGNIAFLGMGIARNAGAPSVIAVLAPMAGFAVGVYVATRIATPLRRPAVYRGEQPRVVVWPHRVTRALGLSLLPHLCFILIWIAAGGRSDVIVTLALLAAWSLAMGMQSAAVRCLEVGGVFTTAATATFIFLFGDLANRSLSVEERRRLVGVLVSLALGATAGSLLLIHAPIYAPLFPFIVTILVVATAAKTFGYRVRKSGLGETSPNSTTVPRR
jgi:uncharacterized membrane protein YoaK (UPF0700 family)